MAISVTNIGTGSAKSANYTIAIPVGGVPAGSLIVLAQSVNSPGQMSPTDSAGNTYTEPGVGAGSALIAFNGGADALNFAYCWNSLALVSGNTINIGSFTRTSATTAFYATGIQTGSDPWDSGFKNTASGNSAAPSVTASAAPAVSGSLCVGLVATNGPSGDTFTQDSTNGTYATPPTRAGTTGAGATANMTIAGGSLVMSGTPAAQKYAPAVTLRTWGAAIVAFKPAATGPTANLNVTLDAATVSAAAVVTIGVTLNQALAAASVVASATHPVTANAAVTAAACTLAATTAVGISAGVAAGLDNATLAAAGTVGAAGISATLNATLANATVSAAAVVTVGGTLNQTLAPASVVAGATHPVTANAAVTSAACTLASTTAVGIKAGVAAGLDNAVLAAAASAGGISASLTATLGNATLVAGATHPVTAAAAIVLGNAGVSATAAVAIAATTAVVLQNVAIAAAATDPVAGAANVVLANVAVASTGAVSVAAAVAAPLAPATLTASAAVAVRANLVATLEDAALSAASVVRNDEQLIEVTVADRPVLSAIARDRATHDSAGHEAPRYRIVTREAA